MVAVAQQQQGQGPLASWLDLAGMYSLRASLGLRAREWPARADPCEAWAGVACHDGRIVGVNVLGFRHTRLVGRAPRFAVNGMRGLTALELFNASGFPLPGEVPAWFGTGLPPSLAVLDLRYAAVNGTLPADLGASGNLTSLLLSGNSLSGQVSRSLLSVKGLRLLDLSGNNFTEELPNASVLLPATGGAFSSLLPPAAAVEPTRRGEASGKACLATALWGTGPMVSAAATSRSSRSVDSEPGRPRRRVRRGPTSAPAGLGEDEHEEEEVGVGEATG